MEEFKIAAVLTILGISLVLFVTEKLRMDVVALLVLGVLGVTKLVTPEEALRGFSNPAVVTVWAMFILSAGLSATGIADFIGRQVLKIAGDGEVRIILVIMLVTGGLSAFMNNIGVAALMLPVVMDICRRTQTSPSRLLMPMAYSSLLGGLTTLIGTPPNLVASTALEQAGHPEFELFEFSVVGVPALVTGAIFIALIGRHMLPSKMPEGMDRSLEDAGAEFQFAHALEERSFQLRVGVGSPLAGRALRDTGIAQVLGLNVLAVVRPTGSTTHVGGDFVFEEGDLLSVQGRVEDFSEFLNWQTFAIASGSEILEVLSSEKVAAMTAEITDDSELAGLEVRETDFQRRFDAHILAIRRPGKAIRKNIANTELEEGDVLILEGRRDALERLNDSPEFKNVTLLSEEQVSDIYPKSDTLLELRIAENSSITGMTIAESGLSEGLNLRVIGIVRKPSPIYFPTPDEKLLAQDRLLVHGRPDTLELIRSIQSLERVDGEEGSLASFSSNASGFTEVTLAPQSGLAGKTLRDLDFRNRYGLGVLSIWRGGQAFGSHLRNMTLEFGDALLLSGPREKVEALRKDPDFLILSSSAYEDTARKSPGKALMAAGIMAAVVLPVLLGWLPIAIAAVAGAAVMITCKCLSMEEAYRAIEWKSVFLIAGMMPLGIAMDNTGAAQWIAQGVNSVAEPFGIWGILIGLYLITMLATTIVPTTALVLIMAPIAIRAAGKMDLDPKLMMMAVAMAASASFTSPISHPANVLVMGPGGYRFLDYVKMGALLALTVMITVLPLIVWKYG